MAIDPLASTGDLDYRGDFEGNLDTALEVASAAVRDAAGTSISRLTSTVSVNGGPGSLLRLPGPVISVASVSIEGTTVASTDYEVLPNGLWRQCGWGRRNVAVAVTYTHGLAVVPADIVDLTCQLAIAWLNHTSVGGGSTAGLASASLDDAAETYTPEASGQVSPVFIPEVTRSWLARRFGGGVEVVGTL